MQAEYTPQAATPAYAGVGPRFVAVLIDGIIIAIVAAILNFIFKQSNLSSGLTGLIALLYYIIMEATSGATLGKKALGLKVVNEDGSPISWSGSIIRNLLRIIDGLFIYLLGAIFVWTSSKKQRLGDKAAHTIVIKTR